ncbi:AzlC family ABC transporter permease [Myceligenerans indicum]|uniref:Branched-chain amino acid ABC transporter permease n=1 Tax=Myceligenerans indicum TaxID=2593663 RepID=A0ABS1LG61_9MICO|nr:AzlC family ABC transporter permease [Myceligenerans indicum]MBL0885200.1 branched-chain amino acid ABC transporter permease [Myceligenerans indicum]
MPEPAAVVTDSAASGRPAEVAAGRRTGLLASTALMPLGLALGVLVVHSGLDWWWAPAIAALILAGSLEFLMVGLLAAAAPFAQIAVTALLVNFRHVFYALSFPLHRVGGYGWKAYSTFALTDEAYALTAPAESEGWSRARILTVQATIQVSWVASVTLGAGLGALIPPWVVGLEFAVTALFAVLTIEAYRVRASIPLPILGLVCALAGLLISPANMLLIGMSLFVVALLASYGLAGRRRASRG